MAQPARRVATHAATRNPVSTIVGIVLAGSYRSTDSGFTGLLPRPLVPIAQTPLIAYVLRWLQASDVERVKVCTNGHAQMIGRHLTPVITMSLAVEYIEDSTPRGPAGCARDAALSSEAETFVVVDATVIPVLDLQSVLDAHARSGAAVTTVVHQQPMCRTTGAPVVTPAGIYVFSRRAFDAVSHAGFQDIKEHLIPTLRRRHDRVAAYVAPDISPRVINAETYLAVNHWMIEQIPGNPVLFEDLDTVITGDVVSHTSAAVHPGATIIGPVVFGSGVSVGAGATVIGPSSIGAGTHIGERAIVSRSVIWNDCSIGHDSFVDQAVIANAVRIRPSSVVEREVRCPVETRRRVTWPFGLKLRTLASPDRRIVDPALP
jgi:NDP-sugar pyrophosphorylase family protein